ncbi:MAG: CsgG/HfaB family protein [Desulfobacterales bacterium]|nr:CsgG/HfaB family protein [Desulfobacterales bacterium]MDX2510678.1 CsgG/HfaB family protein [Desulfobacterales bacterium]
MLKAKNIYLLGSLLLMTAVLVFNGCAVKTSGAVRDDSSLTGISDELAPSEEYTGPKLRVGVVNFQNKTPSKYIGIGEAAADILGTILQKTGRFIIIPQQDVASILGQQAMGASGAVNPATAAKMGKILGLNAMVTGAITAYSEAEEGADYLVYKKKKQIARVTVDYRIVDTTTGIQMVADSGQGVYEKKTGGVLGLGSKSSYDADLRDGALRDALTKAMVNMLPQFESQEWTGRIATIKGRTVYLNAGQKTGLKVGDLLMVQELGEEIIDPQTNVSLGRAPGSIKGELMVTGFFGRDGSMATIKSGAGFKLNDLVKYK